MVKQSTIKKLTYVFEALKEQPFEGTLSEFSTEQKVTPSFVQTAFKLGLIQKTPTGGYSWPKEQLITDDLIVRIVNNASAKKTQNNPESNRQLISFDKAVEFAAEASELAIAFGVEVNQVPNFVREVSQLFKKYKD